MTYLSKSLNSLIYNFNFLVGPETKSNPLEKMNQQQQQWQSAQNSEISVTDIISSGPHFIQLPYKIRRNLYKQAGVIRSQSIRHLSCWSGYSGSHRVPEQIPVAFYNASEELVADVLLVWWSENVFVLLHEQILQLLQLGYPKMWSSLRHLEIGLTCTRLSDWQQVCNSLKAFSPPSQLRLCLGITMFELPKQDHATTVRDALYPMLTLPMLKSLSIHIAPARFDLGAKIHRMATYVVKRHVRQSVERRSPILAFRFIDLPAEIQLMILRFTDLVAPAPVTASSLKGYVLNQCYSARCVQPRLCCEGYYHSSGNCWSLPANVFYVNRHIRMMSEEVFFSCNQFIVDVQLASYPAPLINWSPISTDWQDERIPPLWNPKHSKFLLSIPPGCIPLLRVLTWHFPTVGNDAALTYERIKHDWVHTIDFIAEHVRPLSRLTIILDMTRLQLADEVMLPVQKLQGLRGLFVRLPKDPNSQVRAAEEHRLMRLATSIGRPQTLRNILA